MFRTVGRVAVKTYAVLFLTAFAGLVVSNLAGLAGMSLLVKENKAELVRPWIHGGWVLGAGIGFIGAITGYLRFSSGAKLNPGRAAWARRREPTATSEIQDVDADSALPSPEPEPASRGKHTKRSGVLGGTLFFGLLGGVVGMVFGCSLLIFVFSLASSPFAPYLGDVSVETRREQGATSRRPRAVLTTSSPIVWRIVGAPAILGAAVGALTGGVGAAFGLVKDG